MNEGIWAVIGYVMGSVVMYFIMKNRIINHKRD